MRRYSQLLLATLTILLLAALVIFLEIPERTRFWFELFTAGHTLVFGLCALACLWLSQLVARGRIHFRLSHYIIAFFLAVLVGGATEIIQPFVGRDGELSDLYRDMLGAVAFLFLAMTFDRQITWDFRSGKWLRYTVRILAPVLIVLIFWPAIKWGGAYIYRDRQMPVLLDFNSSVMRLFTRVANGRLDIVPAPVDWPAAPPKVAMLTLYAGVYPGLTLKELSPDWSRYRELTFALFSARTDTLVMEFRVNDRHHNEKYNDRFNTILKVTPGLNQLVFPLDRISKTASGRFMDLTDMGTIVLFAHRPTDSLSLYLSSIRLQ
ncbi:MAG: VanZ family protein [bacterium]|nr:VanZ family protein [bacterium]